MLQRYFPSLTITVSKKADSLFPIVSAASICAKVIRDYHLRTWEFKEESIPIAPTSTSSSSSSSSSTSSSNQNFIRYSRTFGSGYPGDPITKQWLRLSIDPVFGFPSIIRFSWQTCTDLLDRKAVPVHWSHEDTVELEEITRPNRRKSLPMSPAAVRAKEHRNQTINRHQFFADRQLRRVTHF